jgi:chromosome segregation ATPase
MTKNTVLATKLDFDQPDGNRSPFRRGPKAKQPLMKRDWERADEDAAGAASKEAGEGVGQTGQTEQPNPTQPNTSQPDAQGSTVSNAELNTEPTEHLNFNSNNSNNEPSSSSLSSSAANSAQGQMMYRDGAVRRVATQPPASSSSVTASVPGLPGRTLTAPGGAASAAPDPRALIARAHQLERDLHLAHSRLAKAQAETEEARSLAAEREGALLRERAASRMSLLDLVQHIHQLQGMLEPLKHDNAGYRAAIESANNRIAALALEGPARAKQAEEAKQTAMEALGESSLWRARFAEADVALARATRDLVEAREARAQVEAEAASLRGRLAESQAEAAPLADALAHQGTQIASLEARVKQLVFELESERSTTRSLTMEVHALHVSESQSGQEALKRERESERARTKKVAELEERLFLAEAELQTARQRSGELERLLEETDRERQRLVRDARDRAQSLVAAEAAQRAVEQRLLAERDEAQERGIGAAQRCAQAEALAKDSEARARAAEAEVVRQRDVFRTERAGLEAELDSLQRRVAQALSAQQRAEQEAARVSTESAELRNRLREADGVRLAMGAVHAEAATAKDLRGIISSLKDRLASQENESEAAQVRAERKRAELTASCERLEERCAQLEADLAHQRQDSAKTLNAAEQVAQQLNEAREDNQRMAAALARARQEFSGQVQQAQQRARDAEGEGSALLKRVKDAEAEAAQQAKRLREVEADLAEAARRLREGEAERAALAKQLQAARASPKPPPASPKHQPQQDPHIVESLRSELRRAEADRSRLEARAAEAEADLVATAARLKASLANLEHADAELGSLRREAEAARTEIPALRGELGQARAELARSGMGVDAARAEAEGALAKVRAAEHETQSLRVKLSYAEQAARLQRDEMAAMEATLREREEALVRKERAHRAEETKVRDEAEAERARITESHRLTVEALETASSELRRSHERLVSELRAQVTELEARAAEQQRELVALRAASRAPSSSSSSDPSNHPPAAASGAFAERDELERLFKRVHQVPSTRKLGDKLGAKLVRHLSAVVERIEISPGSAAALLDAIDPTLASPQRGGGGGGGAAAPVNTAEANAALKDMRDLRSFTERTLSIFRELRTVGVQGAEGGNAAQEKLGAHLDTFQAMAARLVHGDPPAGEGVSLVVGLIARLMQDSVKQRRRVLELSEGEGNNTNNDNPIFSRALTDKTVVSRANNTTNINNNNPHHHHHTNTVAVDVGVATAAVPSSMRDHYRAIIDLITEYDKRLSESAVDRVLRSMPRHPNRPISLAQVKEALSKSSAMAADTSADFYKQLARLQIRLNLEEQDTVVRGLSRLYGIIAEARRLLNDSFGDALLTTAERAQRLAEKEAAGKTGLAYRQPNRKEQPSSPAHQSKPAFAVRWANDKKAQAEN